MKEININISGRIPNYIFGILPSEYHGECEKAVSFASQDVETMEEFLNLLYGTVLVGANDGIEEFKRNMDMVQFKEHCPLLFEFFTEAEGGDIGHYQFYEAIFDMAWRNEVNLIEDDAYITITVDDEEFVEKQKLADFLGTIERVGEEIDPKAFATANAFWEKHGERFNIDGDTSEYTVWKTVHGVLQLNEWISPKGFSKYQTRERNLTFMHDNIVDFDFSIEAEDFDLSKLVFLRYANATDFHRSAPEYVGSFVAYDNDLIHPNMNIHRDKGFSLYYEPGFLSYDFLIRG